MARLFGLVKRDGSPLTDKERVLAQSVVPNGRVCSGSQSVLLLSDGPQNEPGDGAPGFISSGQVYNRTELIGTLALPQNASDQEILHTAYLRFGKNAPARIVGDWCFAAYDSTATELVLARDHFGTGVLYYAASEDHFAFSNSRRTLINLGLFAIGLDELYLAQVLTSWSAYHSCRTIHDGICRLQPAHVLTLTPAGYSRQYYWRLEDVAECQRPRRSDYVEGFRAVFDTAVRERIPDEGGVATMLSGGLDSGSVTATAAYFLMPPRRLTAYTSVPCAAVGAALDGSTRFGDEFPFASATANAWSNIDLRQAAAANANPIAAIREALPVLMEPQHSAENLYWMLDIFRQARAGGADVLLTGQMGNGGISWTGGTRARPWAAPPSIDGLRNQIKQYIKKTTPAPVWQVVQRYRGIDWRARTAISADLARHFDIFERRLSDPDEAPYLPLRGQRLRMLKPGRALAGDFYASAGVFAGLDIVDPTADPRVLEYCLSVPDSVFFDPDSGLDRWLIREAMKDRLPDVVRLNTRRGRQAADLVARLRACRDDVEAALDECTYGAATAYLDVPYMRQVWARIQAEDSRATFGLAATVLMRGLMAGLFVNGFGRSW